MNVTNHKNSTTLLLIGVLLLAAILRLYQLDFGRPFLYHPDEIKLVTQAGRLLETRFMDKDAYFGIRVYPPFYTYMLAGAMGVYILGGLVTGHFESLSSVTQAYQTDPFQFFMVSRLLVVLMGVATVYLLYLLAKRLYSNKIALIAALLLAVSFLHVRNSHFGTVDVPSTFLGIWTIYLAVLIQQTGRLNYYMLSGILLSLAVATKFSMGLLVLPIVFAHFSRSPVREWLKALVDKKIWLTAVVSFVTFLIACPIIWLDFQETWGGILGTSRFEKVGKIGSGGGFLSYWTGDQSDGFGAFYPNSIPATFGIVLTILMIVGIVLLIVRFRKGDWLLISFLIPTYYLFEHMSIKAMRHLLPLAPLFVLAAAIALFWLADRLDFRGFRPVLISLVLVFVCVWNGLVSINYMNDLSSIDPRTEASAWIAESIPENSTVMVENFPPPILDSGQPAFLSDMFDVIPADMTRKSVQQSDSINQTIAKHDTIWYVADDFTRQIFTWKHTRVKYQDIVQDRKRLFQWIERQAEDKVVFQSQHPRLQPTISIYKLVPQK